MFEQLREPTERVLQRAGLLRDIELMRETGHTKMPVELSVIEQLIDEADAMKQFGIRIKNVREKNGKLEKTSKTPKPLAKNQHQKAARQAKAWKGKSK